jgi:hypothetical protein
MVYHVTSSRLVFMVALLRRQSEVNVILVHLTHSYHRASKA